MQDDNRSAGAPISLYTEVPTEQLAEVLPGPNGWAKFVTSGEWSAAISKLEELQDGYDFVPLLLGDPDSGGEVRWLALLDSIDNMGGETIVTVSCLEELAAPLPLSQLTPYGVGKQPASWRHSKSPIICVSPNAVFEYLERNEISPAEQNILLFHKCILFHYVPQELPNTHGGDLFSEATTGAALWENLATLLYEAEAEHRVLNAVFPDPLQPSCVGWLGIVRNVEIDDEDVLISFQTMYDLRKMEPRFPTEILVTAMDEASPHAGGTEKYEVCEQAWFVNDFLNCFFREATATEFEDALTSVKLSTKQRAMLCYHYTEPNHIMSMGRLADLMGYKNFNAANLHYGKLAAQIGELVGFPPNAENISVFACPSGPDTAGHFQWQMRQQLAEALENLGWV